MNPGDDTPPQPEPARRVRPPSGWIGLRVGINVLALAAAGVVLWFGKGLLLPVVLAILLTLLLNPAVSLVERARLPRWLAALMVLVVVVGAVGYGVNQLSAPAQRWLDPRSPEWRKLELRVREAKKPLEQIQGAQERVADIAQADPPGRKPPQVVVERRDPLQTLEEMGPLMFGAVTTIVLLYFLLASGDLFLRKLIRVLPKLEDKKKAVGIARSVQIEIGHYFATIASINVGLGAVTAAVLWGLGMPSPVFWGALAGLLNFVPYAGPATTLALLTAGAFVSLNDWASIVAVPLAYFALTLIEGQVVQPLLLGRRLRLNVVVTFLTVVFWGWMWGFGGIVVAVPLLVVVKICADHIASMSTLGEFLSRE